MNPPPHSTTIKELFAGRRFEIPSYQRAYSWGEEQLSQFIEDLSESSNSHPYHLGHFLFERDEEKPDALYVIDGQQRLTTCIIFFSVASKVLERNDIAEHYLMTNGNVKFKTVPYDNDFFVDAIIEYKKNSKKGTKSQKNIYDARKYFERKLDKASDEEIRSWIEKLENASITTHVVGDKAEAAQIFAYQNDRGKDLTNLEVLKAYLSCELFKSEGSEGDKACVEAIFADIYQNIVRISLHEDEVLDYYWQAIGPKGYNSEDTVSEIKAWINKVKKEERPDKIKEFVKGLRTAFGLVEKIEKPNKFFDEETAYFVECLNRLGYMSLSYPLLIRAELFGVSSETKNFARLIKLLENLTFRYWVRGGRAVMETYLQDVISEEGANGAESFNKMIDSIKWKLNNEWGYWSDAEIHECINWGYFYNSPVCNYLLWRYEHYLRNKLSWDDGIPDETIEHIAPRTPPDNLAESGYGDYKARKKSEGIESGEWLHCVGNLVLLDKPTNISLSNRPFKKKLRVYKKCPLQQQKDIRTFATDKDTDHPIWDKAAIERRHNAILEVAMEIWDLNKI